MTESNFERAVRLVSFDLTYARSAEPRRFNDDGIDGPQIDDAFRPGRKSSGEWTGACYDTGPIDYRDAVRAFFATAVTEAIHEACEWFREDGRIVVDPHGYHDAKIVDASEQFARNLFDSFAREIS